MHGVKRGKRWKAVLTHRSDLTYRYRGGRETFSYEDDLRVKSARLVELDTLLNLDGKGRSQPESVIAKSARPSVLDSLKRPVPPRSPEKKPKQHEEVR